MKVLRILGTFTKEEWHWLGKFVASAAHNQHEEVTRLFEILKKKRGENPSPEAICKQLLGKTEAAEKARFHHVSNYLLKTIEDFLVWWELQKDDMKTDLNYYLLKSLKGRGLDDLFLSNLESVRRQNEAFVRRDASHLRSDYALRYEDFQHFLRTDRAKKVDLQGLSDALETSFLAEKLRLACATRSIKAVLSRDVDDGMLHLALQFLDENEAARKAPAVEVYYYGLKTMIDPDAADEHYFNLKSSFLANRTAFDVPEQRELLLMLVNYCLQKRNKGDVAFVRELLDLYKMGFEYGYFVQNGELSRVTYTNAASNAIFLEEFEFAEDFIEKYRPFLPESQREGAYNYIKGRLFHAKKDYSNAQRFLLMADHDDPLMNIAVNSLLLKCYFEDGEFGLLQNHFENFSAWLRRQKKLGYQKDNAVNIVKLARRLISLAPSDAKGREKLKAEVLAAKPLSEKEWFLNQIDRRR